MFVKISDLKQCLCASKDTSKLVKRVVLKRIKHVPWYVLKKSCFVEFHQEFYLTGWVQLLNDRYSCSTEMVQSALEIVDEDHIIGKHTISIWSFRDQCYLLHTSHPFKQRVYTNQYIALVYNKQHKGTTLVRVYSFYKDEDTAYYIFLLNEAQVEILEAPKFNLNTCMSPNGKYIYLFDRHAILSHTGSIYPIISEYTFTSRIAKQMCYKWIDSTTFTIDASEFKCKTQMNITMNADSLTVF